MEGFGRVRQSRFTWIELRLASLTIVLNPQKIKQCLKNEINSLLLHFPSCLLVIFPLLLHMA